MDHKRAVSAYDAPVCAEKRNYSDRLHASDIVEMYLYRGCAEKIVEANSISDDSAGRLEEKVYGLNTSAAGYGNSVVKALNSQLIYRACEQAIEIGREGVGGWLLLIRHSTSSTPKTVWPFA